MKGRLHLLFIALFFIFVLTGWLFSEQVDNVSRGAADQTAPPTPVPPPQIEQLKIETPIVSEEVHLYCANPFQYTCTQSWPSVDPTGHVRPDISGEVRALRQMRNIIHKNPTWTSDQVQETLAKTIFTEQRRSRAMQVFQWARNQIKLWIEDHSHVFNQEEQEILLKRIDQITLNLPPPASAYADAIDLITKNALYYERTPQGELRLRVGGAYLMNTTSWYNIVFTFAHEIAHAIDPCEMKHFGFVPRAYKPLIQCFVDSGWVEPKRSQCESYEQVSEVFADWLASEIFARAHTQWTMDYADAEKVSAAVNATRDLCEQSLEGQSLVFRHHQDPKIRIGQILGAHPDIQASLGCPTRNQDNHCRLPDRSSDE